MNNKYLLEFKINYRFINKVNIENKFIDYTYNIPTNKKKINKIIEN